MRTINLNMNLNNTLNMVVNNTLCIIRPSEGFNLFKDIVQLIHIKQKTLKPSDKKSEGFFINIYSPVAITVRATAC